MFDSYGVIVIRSFLLGGTIWCAFFAWVTTYYKDWLDQFTERILRSFLGDGVMVKETKTSSPWFAWFFVVLFFGLWLAFELKFKAMK